MTGRPARLFSDFTTHHGSTTKIIAVLDSDGNLRLAGRLITEQKDLGY
ncbi:DUF6342 family protein [Streptomyces sp. NPDC088707]